MGPLRGSTSQLPPKFTPEFVFSDTNYLNSLKASGHRGVCNWRCSDVFWASSLLDLLRASENKSARAVRRTAAEGRVRSPSPQNGSARLPNKSNVPKITPKPNLQ